MDSEKIETRIREERKESDGKYAPYIAWTVLLGFLTLLGVAVAMRFIGVIFPA